VKGAHKQTSLIRKLVIYLAYLHTFDAQKLFIHHADRVNTSLSSIRGLSTASIYLPLHSLTCDSLNIHVDNFSFFPAKITYSSTVWHLCESLV